MNYEMRKNITCGGVLWWLGYRCCGGKGNFLLASGWEIRTLLVQYCGWVSCCFYNYDDRKRRGFFDMESECSRSEDKSAVYT